MPLTQQQADNLNDRFDQLAEKLDLLDKAPIDKVRPVNATISSWQDYYWSGDNQWNQLPDWEQRYITAARLVDGLASQTTSKARIQDTTWFKESAAEAASRTGPGSSSQPIRLPPLLVTAAPPPRPPPPPEYVPPKPAPRYTSAPLPPVAPLPAMSMGTVDTSEWGNVTPQDAQAFARDPGNAGWDAPVYAPHAKGGTKGLLALVGSILAGIYAKRAGWF